MNAQLLAYFCQIQSLMVQVERLKVDNTLAEIDGLPPKWRGDHFANIESELDDISRSIRNLNDTGPR